MLYQMSLLAQACAKFRLNKLNRIIEMQIAYKCLICVRMSYVDLEEPEMLCLLVCIRTLKACLQTKDMLMYCKYMKGFV